MKTPSAILLLVLFIFTVNWSCQTNQKTNDIDEINKPSSIYAYLGGWVSDLEEGRVRIEVKKRISPLECTYQVRVTNINDPKQSTDWESYTDSLVDWHLYLTSCQSKLMNSYKIKVTKNLSNANSTGEMTVIDSEGKEQQFIKYKVIESSPWVNQFR